MTTKTPEQEDPEPRKSVIHWLLDSDPSIRWQVMRDLMGESARSSPVSGRGLPTRVGVRGSSTFSGRMACGVVAPPRRSGCPPFHPAAAAGPGVGPDERASTEGRGPRSRPGHLGAGIWRLTVLRGRSRALYQRQSPCLGGYFGEASDRLLDRLLDEQLADGGWNCEAERGSAFVVPFDDLRAGGTPGVREGERSHDRGDRRPGPGTGVPAGASHVPAVVNRRGDRSQRDAVHVPDHVALRCAEGPGLLADRRRRARRTGRRGHRSCGEDGTGRAMAARGPPRRSRSTSTWKAAPASPAAGTHSAPCACWTGIQHKTNAGAAGNGTGNNLNWPVQWHSLYYGGPPSQTGTQCLRSFFSRTGRCSSRLYRWRPLVGN